VISLFWSSFEDTTPRIANGFCPVNICTLTELHGLESLEMIQERKWASRALQSDHLGILVFGWTDIASVG